jgi:hypothetical protein
MLMDSLSRFVSIRRTAKLLYRRDRSHYDLGASKMAPTDIEAFVAALNRDGFADGLRLPPQAVSQMLEFSNRAICYGDANPAFGFRYADKLRAQKAAGRVFSKGTYLFLDDLEPLVDGLARDPLLMAIAARYLGCTPAITGCRLWWVFATPESDYDASITTSFFHYDKDDYSAVRLFFYLTEVDDDHGPHVVVRGSHVDKKMSQLVALAERTDGDITGYYGRDKLVTIYGNSGSGFAEDPFCFHKATRPVAGDRLMLEMKYAARNYNIFPEPDRAAAALILDESTRST